MNVLTMTVDAGLATIVLDVPGEAQNTLGNRLAVELDRILDRLERDEQIIAAVLASGKPESFLAGADIAMLQSFTAPDAGEDASRRAQKAMDRLAGLRIPVVAAIRGACLGAGLELALACRARVAADDARTVLGLPEVQLGLLPGAGGTQRLPRLIGLADALDLILTGRQIKARRARSLGMVDEVCPAAIVRDVAASLARDLAAGKAPPRPKRAIPDEIRELALEQNPIGRALVFRKAHADVLKKTGGHYPAPLQALEVVKIGLDRGMEAGLAAEAKAFGLLVGSPVARNLMRLFMAQSALKKELGGDAVPRPVDKLAVVGGGLMGGGIAYVAAHAGTEVRLKERDDEGVLGGLAHVKGILDGRRSLSRLEAADVLARVSGTIDYSGFRRADLVIEAVFEDLGLKQAVLRDVENVVGEECVFASNTSTLPIRDIARASRRPENVLGMHFFSPVHRMPLLEVVTTDRTSPRAVATAVAFGKRMGKTVIVVNDGPGFYTSRILAPYLNEAAHLLAEGVAVEAIDNALVRWGFPVGPLALLDEVGIDVAAKAAQTMHDAFRDRMAPPPIMQTLLDDGRAGRKNGKGFYSYAAGKRGGVDPSVYSVLGIAPQRTAPPWQEIAERCVLHMVNEAVRCLGEGILRSTRDGDVGAILGLGFPPFRGGPFRFLDGIGAGPALVRLGILERQHGARFVAAPMLRDRKSFG